MCILIYAFAWSLTVGFFIGKFKMNNVKDIPNYEGLYAISLDGIVFSKPRNHWKGGWIKPCVDKYGYQKIDLHKGINHIKRYFIHRLVAQTYIPNPENKPQVNHIDGDKQNNHVSNLEWCTASENQKHAVRTGLLIQRKGGNSPCAKKIINTTTSEIFLSITDAAKISGISRTAIGNCLKLTTKTAGGFKWEYYNE